MTWRCILFTICVLTGTFSGEGCAQGTRSISVQVQTILADGSAVADVPVQVVSYEGAAFGMTDALGQMDLTVEAPDGDSRIVVRIWDGGYHDLTPVVREQAENRWKALRDQYAFRERYVDISEGVFSYGASITLGDAVRLSGRLVDGSGTPVAIGSVRVLAWSTGSMAVFDQTGGVFDVGGVPKGTAIEVFFKQAPSGQIHYTLLDASQTLFDTDVGDLVVEDDAGEGWISLQLQNWDNTYDAWMSALDRQVGLVSVDGQLVFAFYLDESRQAVQRRWEDPSELPHLPAGEYYVTPGGFLTRPGVALLRSVIAGRQSALDAAGVPRVVITSGGTVTLNMDVVGAQDAILSVGEDLVTTSARSGS